MLAFWNIGQIGRSQLHFQKKLIKLVEQKTQQISKTPFIYPTSGFKDHRIAIVKDFSIFYKVTEVEIIITSFWDNRQNPDKLLTILK